MLGASLYVDASKPESGKPDLVRASLDTAFSTRAFSQLALFVPWSTTGGLQ